MSVTKEKGKDTWKLYISKGYNAVTGKRNRFIKRNIKTRKDALELESYYRITKYGDYSTIKGASFDILYEIMKDEDKKKQRKESYIPSKTVVIINAFQPTSKTQPLAF